MVSDDGFVTHLDTAVGIISQFIEMVKHFQNCFDVEATALF